MTLTIKELREQLSPHGENCTVAIFHENGTPFLLKEVRSSDTDEDAVLLIAGDDVALAIQGSRDDADDADDSEDDSDDD